MAKNRAKRRSLSQRIGEKGESLFATWALDNSLVPQKLEKDYGIDFFCQVMKPISGSSEELTGAILAVQVRSVMGKARRRVKVDRTDVESALRLSVPYCLIGVDVDAPKIYHLFLDETLIREFHPFLESCQKTMSLRLVRFNSTEAEFKGSLFRMTAPATQSRIGVVKAQLKLSSDLPGASLKILQSSGPSSALVEVPWITQVFQVEPNHREQVAKMVFEEGHCPSSTFPGLSFKESLKTVSPLVDGPIILGGIFEREVELLVRLRKVQKKENFLLRRFDDERAYVHRSGLLLIVSDPRLDEGLYKHFMSIRIVPSSDISLGELAQSSEFFKLLQPGAVINEVGREGIPVENWPGLERVGKFLIGIEKVYQHLQIDLSEAFLNDLQVDEFGKTITLMELLIDGIGLERFAPGFLLGPPAGKAPDPKLWRKVAFRVPILANLKERGVEVWVEGIGYVYLFGKRKLICGFRIAEQKGWTCLVRDQRFEKGPYPELLIYEDWPPITLFRENPDEALSFKVPIQNALKGQLWPIDNEHCLFESE